MSLARDEIEAWAASLIRARAERRCRDPITSDIELNIADAYKIQDAVTAARLARGERIVGWKLGYTSVAMREQMGIDQPNFGPLTDAMIVAHGDTVGPGLLQPRVEPEIGLRFARPLAGRATRAEVLDAIDEAFTCLEVVDSVYRDYRFQLVDNTADGSSAARVVVGPALLAINALDQVTVMLSHNDIEVGVARGSAASGHPVNGVVWLVEQLAQRGDQISAGDIVITGGLTKAVSLHPGDVVAAVYDGGMRVEVRCSTLS
jgi:2-keto-4-pentenoate hydratase